jgi:hypothetical protein
LIKKRVQFAFICCFKFFSSETKLRALLTSVRMDYISVGLVQYNTKDRGTGSNIRGVTKAGNQKLNLLIGLFERSCWRQNVADYGSASRTMVRLPIRPTGTGTI